MSKTLAKDYGQHKAGTAPSFDPARAAWLEQHGYFEPPPPEWTLATPPEIYLERFPDGPNAELARRVLGLDTEEEG